MNDLNETELLVLRMIRTSPHRVSQKKISEVLHFSKEKVMPVLKSLLEKNYLRQDKRDKVNWDDAMATFFTEYSKRDQIDERLKIKMVSEYPSPRRLQVFLCHSSSDKPVVRTLFHRLSEENVDCWLDEEKLLGGQVWTYEIKKAVRSTDVVIVCLSHDSINKVGYIQKEIKFALDVADEQPEDTIFIIPLKLEECKIPDRLSHWQWIDYFEENGYQKLLNALKKRASALDIMLTPKI